MATLRKLSDRENELYQRVDEVLHYLWDPIGVSDSPAARDEYHSYVPQIFSLLKQGKDEVGIANHLGNLSSISMGCEKNTKRDMNVAEILINSRDDLLDD